MGAFTNQLNNKHLSPAQLQVIEDSLQKMQEYKVELNTKGRPLPCISFELNILLCALKTQPTNNISADAWKRLPRCVISLCSGNQPSTPTQLTLIQGIECLEACLAQYYGNRTINIGGVTNIIAKYAGACENPKHWTEALEYGKKMR